MANIKQQAYSLIELVVIITVIGILAAISTVSYSSWRKSTITTQLKNDLTMAASAMENARNFDGSYPRYINNIYTPSQGISIDGGSNKDQSEYLLNVISGKQSYSINQEGAIKQEHPPAIYLDANKPLSFLDDSLVWNDISGNNNNLQFNASTTSEDLYPASDNDKVWGIVFNNNIRASTNFSPSDYSITWEAWVKFSNVGALNFKNTFLSLGQMEFYFMTDRGHHVSLFGYTRIGSLLKKVSYTDGAFSANYWNHLVFSVNYDSDNNLSTLSLYKNGELTEEEEYKGRPFYDNNFIVGGTADTYFNGSISLIKVFDSALTDNEVKQEYDLLKYRYQNNPI